MRYIPISLFIILFFSVKANDTLTLRQVFNYDIGDTFDYLYSVKYVVDPEFGNDYYGQTYIRYVITNKTVSTDSNTVMYIRQQVYPDNRLDTLSYTNLDSNISYILNPAPNLPISNGRLADGRITNTLAVNDSPTLIKSVMYGAGLGLYSSS
jgi:hypothetical protein